MPRLRNQPQTESIEFTIGELMAREASSSSNQLEIMRDSLYSHQPSILSIQKMKPQFKDGEEIINEHKDRYERENNHRPVNKKGKSEDNFKIDS